MSVTILLLSIVRYTAIFHAMIKRSAQIILPLCVSLVENEKRDESLRLSLLHKNLILDTNNSSRYCIDSFSERTNA
jgi:hypothetical protein